MVNRYDTSNIPEGQYQPGSNNRVLLNKIDITDLADIDEVELNLLEKLYAWVFEELSEDQTITVADLSEWHRRWMGNVYVWAGQERLVNVSKDDFHFAAADQITRLLSDLDKKFLGVYTPCHGMDDEQLVEAIAIVHIEFILIHPFREGNGRLSRLLANVMALQAGKPELDFSYWDANKTDYFAAIHIGLDDYVPMKELVRQVLHDTG